VTAQRELLEAAARCYLRAGDQGDACRCFESLGAWGEAASLHENAGRVGEAAVAYERAGQFLDAARCYRAGGQRADEVRCLVRGGEGFRAAWILAHELGRAREAEALVGDLTRTEKEDETAAELVLARCDVAHGERNAAARRVRQVLSSIREIPAGSPWRRLVNWALSVCEALRRPDLGALLLTTTAKSGVNAEVMWDQWAERTFGEAVRSPVPLEREDKIAGAGEPEEA
jgi:hypothetical protein